MVHILMRIEHDNAGDGLNRLQQTSERLVIATFAEVRNTLDYLCH